MVYNILAHYVFAMPCSIVYQEKKTSILYNATCKEEWKFKKNTTCLAFNTSIILCGRLKNSFQSQVARFDGVKLCL
jgi:hypothetical protein